MITPDSPERQYSTRLRTALVLTGSGTAGAYHAGVLRALHEAGVKVDLVAGRGIGVASAMFAAVDGSARLSDAQGIWKSAAAARFYGWRAPLRAAGWAAVAACAILAIPLALLALAVLVAIAGMLLTFVGLPSAGAAATAGYARWIEALFAPSALPTVIPRLVVVALLVAVVALAASLAAGLLAGRPRRRTRQGLLLRLLGAPLDASAPFQRFRTELWSLIRGVAPLAAPTPLELARKYVELLSENLGQPGFRELLVIGHDMDARRDVVFAMLNDGHRHRFLAPRPVPTDGSRQAEAFDLAGAARDHALDALAAALAVPVATEPHLIAFAAEGPWRGESHRTCDRPGALARLLEEVAAAGAEQVIVVGASPPPARPHELSAGRADLRGRAGEQLAAFEAATLRDAMEQFAGRFAGLFAVRPLHNPVGPLDFGGVYDERSDRIHTLSELCDRGYEDAYRQFIEPVVGASGEQIQSAKPVTR